MKDFNYYPSKLIQQIESNSLSSDQLKEELFKVMSYYHIRTEDKDLITSKCLKNQKCYSQKRSISYKAARIELFGNLHLEKDYRGRHFVKDLYCENNYGSNYGVGPGKIPSSSVMNCEHTWPQSKFNPSMSKSLQKTDLHHLYPVNNRANSSRGNHMFAEVNGRVINENCDSSLRGNAIGTSLTAFEPPASHKGNVARAMFYFSVRFKLPIDEIQERYLRNWNQEDPVDNEERERNQKIFEYQNNRNPFIDQPDLISTINDF
ncbi:putative endonuclease [Halobacteriovorax marinus SJ]|uniref:Endonuclease n=1 Tax=Halobacteriovorax marinus (strain ATCC BAA-682 / DSM 15412 / SJ) TaxID=862908 RepID=E1WZL0_HALMS|nr:putative endonuclease [Halobacteriovorax marinus SJ]